MRPSSSTGTAAVQVSPETEAAQTSCRSSPLRECPGPWPRAAAPGQRRPASRPRGRPPRAPRSVGCSAASTTARLSRTRSERPPPTPAVHGSTASRTTRASMASAVNASTATVGHDLRVLGRDADPEDGQTEAERGGDLRSDQPASPGRRAPARPRGARRRPARGTSRRRVRRARAACRAPTMSRTTSPSATVVSASAATPRSRRASHWPASAVVTVSPTSTAVRPPTPSHDQATARKITAATSRQVAPSPSRILGTEAALRPAGGAGGADGASRAPGTARRTTSPAGAEEARLEGAEEQCGGGRSSGKARGA